MGLGITMPWYIKKIELVGERIKKELHIYLDHEKGRRFSYEGSKRSVYDHQERESVQEPDFYASPCSLIQEAFRV